MTRSNRCSGFIIAEPPFARRGKSGIELQVRLTPNGRKDAVEGMREASDGAVHLAARVRAVPEKGAANRALELLIAKWLGVPPSTVAVVAGGKARVKTVVVEGDPELLLARLAARSP